MWEWIKKLFSFITAIRQWFADQKKQEVKKLETEREIDRVEVQKEYEEAKTNLQESGNSPDVFESELDKLRNRQSS